MEKTPYISYKCRLYGNVNFSIALRGKSIQNSILKRRKIYYNLLSVDWVQEKTELYWLPFIYCKCEKVTKEWLEAINQISVFSKKFTLIILLNI